MLLPRGDEYLDAIQNPVTAFSDRELRACKPETDQFGIPKPYSGGFTTTFHLKNHSHHWAARCFTRRIPDLQKRYEAIGSFLRRNSNSFFVEADYLNQGIKVNGGWHPIIKMRWLDGQTLNSFIDSNISRPDRIKHIAQEFLNLVKELERLTIAHGDLQHGNILVKQDRLYLIDYDGMFLPELSFLKSNEIGHLNYQHPGRAASHYDEIIDRFSSIVIYLGLSTISLSPSLWRKYDNSENILFRADDFINPDSSQLIEDISHIKELSHLANRFKEICKVPTIAIPNLDSFISSYYKPHKDSMPLGRPVHANRKSQYIVISASQKGSLLEHIGDRVEVVGRITDFHLSTTRYGKPFLFLNFGSFPRQSFTLVLWSSSLDAFAQSGCDAPSLVGSWVRVTGVIGSYSGRPQMPVERPSQIQVLEGDFEAHQLLMRQGFSQETLDDSRFAITKPRFVLRSEANTQILHSRPEHDETIFNKLYANKVTENVSSYEIPNPSVLQERKVKQSPPMITPKMTQKPVESLSKQQDNIQQQQKPKSIIIRLIRFLLK